MAGSCTTGGAESGFCRTVRDGTRAKWEHKKAVAPSLFQNQAAAGRELGSLWMVEAQAPVAAKKKMSQSLKQGQRTPCGAQAATKGFVARLRSHTPERGAHRPCGPEPTSGVVGLLLRLRSAWPSACRLRFAQVFFLPAFSFSPWHPGRAGSLRRVPPLLFPSFEPGTGFQVLLSKSGGLTTN